MSKEPEEENSQFEEEEEEEDPINYLLQEHTGETDEDDSSDFDAGLSFITSVFISV